MSQQIDLKFSEEYMNYCCSYAEKLLQSDLPVLFDGNHIKNVLQLKRIKEDCYHEFPIPKMDGVRLISAPSRPLKIRQQWIYKNILQKHPCSQYAHGFIRDRSIVTNAAVHAGFRYTVCVDISDFFPSISQEQIGSVFNKMGYSESASSKLGELCSHKAILPQGAPTSPCLSNIICCRLDDELYNLATANQCVFTRYADDITFSSNEDITQIASQIQRILLRHEFSLNETKCRVYGPSQPKHITGLVVQDTAHVPKAYKRHLRQELYFCKKFGVTVHLENIQATKRIHYREHLYGKAYFIKMVEPELGMRFLDELDAIEWPD